MNNTKKTILISLAACLVFSVVGYFCLFSGLHMLDHTKENNIILIIGYILMWPTILLAKIQSELFGNNTVEYWSGTIVQIIGYLLMGFGFKYALSKINCT